MFCQGQKKKLRPRSHDVCQNLHKNFGQFETVRERHKRINKEQLEFSEEIKNTIKTRVFFLT